MKHVEFAEEESNIRCRFGELVCARGIIRDVITGSVLLVLIPPFSVLWWGFPTVAFRRLLRCTYQTRGREERGGYATHTIVDTGTCLAFAAQIRQVVLHLFELPLCPFFPLFIVVIFTDLIWES
jgi:hypothetical protein